MSSPAQARDKAFQERQRAARAAAKVAATAAEVRRGAGPLCSLVPLLFHSCVQAKRRANAEAAAALRAESQLISDFTAVISAGEHWQPEAAQVSTDSLRQRRWALAA